MELQIKGFLETSFLDWDGQIVSVVYLPLCNLHCPFCHNSGLVEHPEQYPSVPAKKIELFLSEHLDFVDGVCLTGGEPCLHKDKGLFEFIGQIKALGLNVKLDTNGTDPQTLKKLSAQGLIDYIAMDFKGPLDERYNKLAGVKVDLDKIKQSIIFLMSAGLPYEFRTTVVPGLLAEKEIEAMARSIAGAEKFVLQQFVAENCWDESLRTVKPYPKDKLDQLASLAKKQLKNVIIRGA